VGFGGFLKKLLGGDDGGGRACDGPDPGPVRFGLPELAERLQAEPSTLVEFEPTYHTFTVPKRSGGYRPIAAPDPETRELQRRVLRRLLDRLATHDAATGFERNRSIVTNALPHVGKAVVVRLDLVDFFARTAARRIGAFYRRIGWDQEATNVLLKLTTLNDALPQGAPTSPRLANLVNTRLDARLDGFARRLMATYTRYADDLTFSFTEDRGAEIRNLIRFVRQVAAEHGYRVHGREKLRIMRAHRRQTVTGLVVNDGVDLPRKTRRKLRAVQHHLRTGRSATMTAEQLAGWRALQAMIRKQRGG
jgi:RNA-directed DNA polymerase